MSVLALLILHGHRTRIFESVRQVVILAVVLGLTLYMATLWPSLRLANTAPADAATWNVWINGPLTDEILSETAQLTGSDTHTVTISGANVTAIGTEGSLRPYSCSVTYFSADSIDTLDDTPWSATFRTSGSITSPTQCGLDTATARDLRVQRGDMIEFAVEFLLPDGTVEPVVQVAEVAAVYETTREIHGIFTALQPDVTTLLAESLGDGVVASDMYLTNPGGEEVILSRLGTALADEQVAIYSQSRYIADSYRAANASVDSAYMTSLIVAGLLVYFVWTLREQYVRFIRRRKSIAILYSLGLPLQRVKRALAAEQAFLGLCSAVPGLVLANWMVSRTLGYGVQSEIALPIIAGLCTVVFAAVAVTVWQFARTLRRFPVAELLTQN